MMMSSNQEISADGVLPQSYVTHDDIVNGLRQFRRRNEEMRSSILRLNEMLSEAARLWNPRGILSEAAVSDYLEMRSRPSRAGVGDDGEGAICAVCHDELHCHGDGGDGTTMIVKLVCGHEYHIPCIKQWLLRKNVCPICRTVTVPL
ncbi:UNVERIFIED_CONTAM: E3 ubiquitin-protein ligase MBR2 [Sesamum latifolium]|uniref:RING-type E3 ubiquitin transferase n=1 Tax=Sesamum latifolium TaxID=2727402 RepID=A0AAW2UGF8_9LAMI